MVMDAFDKCVGQTFAHRQGAPGLGGLTARRISALLLGCKHLLGAGQQLLGRILAPIENHVFYQFAQTWFDLLISHRRGGVDNGHVHAFGYGMVEEHGVHGFTQIVVAAE